MELKRSVRPNVCPQELYKRGGEESTQITTTKGKWIDLKGLGNVREEEMALDPSHLSWGHGEVNWDLVGGQSVGQVWGGDQARRDQAFKPVGL